MKNSNVAQGRLVEIVRSLSPFLDSQGRSYCHAKPEGEEVRAVIDLDGDVSTALLTFLYHEKHQEVPSGYDVKQALNLIRGELWFKRPPGQTRNRMWAATVEAVVKAVSQHGDFVGSAEEALNLLKDSVDKDSEAYLNLPLTADQLGVVLVRIGLLLRGRNIELFRPPRRDRARLWCWRELVPNPDTSDTPDTSARQASGSHGHVARGEERVDDTPDTYTPDQQRWMDAYQQGDQPHDRSAA